MRPPIKLLYTFSYLFLCTPFAFAQSPVVRYQTAIKRFKPHLLNIGFLHDDSAAAVASMNDIWSAAAENLAEFLARHPLATVKEISQQLCTLGKDSSGCDDRSSMVLQLKPGLFVVAFSAEDVLGTVFVVGIADKERNSKPKVVWSISHVSSQPLDPEHLLEAWTAERAGENCRSKNSSHKPGTCGPLYASLGLLPSDSFGRPRFYINAGYAQLMGATIGKQATIWQWNGDHAELLWMDWYDEMIDQRNGISFENGILKVGEKEEYHSFLSCGSCEGKQEEKRVQVLPEGIVDLGKFSLVPELDFIDELFWRLNKGESTADYATQAAADFIGRRISEAKKVFPENTKDFFTLGDLDDFSIKKVKSSESLCLSAEALGPLELTLHPISGKAYRLVKVKEIKNPKRGCHAL